MGMEGPIAEDLQGRRHVGPNQCWKQVQEEVFQCFAWLLCGTLQSLNCSDLTLDETIRPGEVGGWSYVVYVIALEELDELIGSEWRATVGTEHARQSILGDELLQTLDSDWADLVNTSYTIGITC